MKINQNPPITLSNQYTVIKEPGNEFSFSKDSFNNFPNPTFTNNPIQNRNENIFSLNTPNTYPNIVSNFPDPVKINQSPSITLPNQYYVTKESGNDFIYSRDTPNGFKNQAYNNIPIRNENQQYTLNTHNNYPNTVLSVPNTLNINQNPPIITNNRYFQREPEIQIIRHDKPFANNPVITNFSPNLGPNFNTFRPRPQNGFIVPGQNIPPNQDNFQSRYPNTVGNSPYRVPTSGFFGLPDSSRNPVTAFSNTFSNIVRNPVQSLSSAASALFG